MSFLARFMNLFVVVFLAQFGLGIVTLLTQVKLEFALAHQCLALVMFGLAVFINLNMLPVRAKENYHKNSTTLHTSAT